MVEYTAIQNNKEMRLYINQHLVYEAKTPLVRVKPLTLLSREHWGEDVDAKKGRTKRKAKVERLNYTLCSKKDRRGVGNVARKANVAIRGANGRRKQGSLNRAYQTRNTDTNNREPVTAYHCVSEIVDRTENGQGEKRKWKTKRKQA